MRRRALIPIGASARAAAGTAVVAAALGSLAAPASAGTSNVGGGSVGDGAITATASSGVPGAPAAQAVAGSAAAGSAGPRPSAPPPCTYVPVPPGVATYLGAGEGGAGTWFVARCSSPTPAAMAFPVVWVPAATPVVRAPAPSTPSVPALVAQAVGRAVLVQPAIELDPNAEQVVNVPTWLWVPSADWQPVTASAAAGSVTATVTAVPIGVLWTFGDGQSERCPGPGIAYQPGVAASAQATYCSHLWTASSASAPGGAFTVTAVIQYRVTVSVVGAVDGVPDLGLHLGPSAQTRVAVSEIEALGVPAGSGGA